MPIGTHPRDHSEIVKVPGSLDLPSTGGGPWRYRIGRMSSPGEETWGAPDPQDVLLDRFAIQVHPVCNAAYRAFVESDEFRDRDFWQATLPHGCVPPWENGDPPQPRLWLLEDFSATAGGDLPVVGVSWFEANAYARWCGGRLPSETQWEVAASYHFEDPPRKRRYPWGDGEDGRTFQDLFGRSSHVGLWENRALVDASRNPTSRCEMMVGFHWEWCRDWFDEAQRTLPQSSARNRSADMLKSVRGGCTLGYAGEIEAASRFAFEPGVALERLGFRCVFDWDFDEGER